MNIRPILFQSRLQASGVAIISLLSLIVLNPLAGNPQPVLAQSPPDFTNHPTAFITAHRGGANEAPENTLAAFARAINLGINPELDVRLSEDGYVVVIHDATVDRTTNGSGTVNNKTLEQLKALDAGSWFSADYAGERIPTFEQVLQLFVANAPGHLIMSVDAKEEHVTMFTKIRDLLDIYDLFDRVYVEVDSAAVAQDIKDVDERIRIAIWASDSAAVNKALSSPHVERIHTRPSLADRASDAHTASKTLMVALVDDQSDWSEINDYPIDGINTNRPATMKEFLKGEVEGLRQVGFTTDEQTAWLYGVHEITLTGDGSVNNPFDTDATVTFTEPLGNQVVVKAFYDGGNTWRARVYISETGTWSWQSDSPDDSHLDNRSGTFVAEPSTLRGMLRKHPRNPRQWITDDGQTFLNLSDTSYTLFRQDVDLSGEKPPYVTDALFQEYVEDDVNLGITSLRAGGCGGYGGWAPSSLTQGDRYERSNWCWDGYDKERFDLDRFQATDRRLTWLLDNYPNMYVQLILFGKTNDVGEEWDNISQSQRNKIMDYQISRWAAWPQLFFLIVNDTTYTPDLNVEMVREIGRYYAANDPWHHLISAGPKRREEVPFTQQDRDEWLTYLHIEKYSEIDAAIVDSYYAQVYDVHLFYGEDWYEQSVEHSGLDPVNPSYYYRRLFWSALLSGGSSNYGGRYPVIHPYSQSGSLDYQVRDYTYEDDPLVGLDNILALKAFFVSRHIDLAYFVPNDSIATDLDPADSEGTPDPSRPQAAYRTDFSEYLIYLPNADDEEQAGGTEHSSAAMSRLMAAPNPDKIPRVRIQLPASTYAVQWIRARDGHTIYADPVITPTGPVSLTAPWQGEDVVLYLSGPPVPPISLPIIARHREGLSYLEKRQESSFK